MDNRLEILTSLYFRGHLLDNAPKLSKTVFEGFNSTISDIEARFQDVENKYSDERVKLALRYAQDFALIEFMFNNSQLELAKTLLEDYISFFGDSTAYSMNYSLNRIGISYIDECVKEKILITPKKLDEIIAQKSLIYSSCHISEIYDKNLLVIASKNKTSKGYLLTFFSTEDRVPQILYDSNPRITGENYGLLINAGGRTHTSSNLEKINVKLREQTANLNQNYALLSFRNTKLFESWYSFRFEMTKIGAMAHRDNDFDLSMSF